MGNRIQKPLGFCIGFIVCEHVEMRVLGERFDGWLVIRVETYVVEKMVDVIPTSNMEKRAVQFHRVFGEGKSRAEVWLDIPIVLEKSVHANPFTVYQPISIFV